MNFSASYVVDIHTQQRSFTVHDIVEEFRQLRDTNII